MPRHTPVSLHHLGSGERLISRQGGVRAQDPRPNLTPRDRDHTTEVQVQRTLYSSPRYTRFRRQNLFFLCNKLASFLTFLELVLEVARPLRVPQEEERGGGAAGGQQQQQQNDERR